MYHLDDSILKKNQTDRLNIHSSRLARGKNALGISKSMLPPLWLDTDTNCRSLLEFGFINVMDQIHKVL